MSATSVSGGTIWQTLSR